LHSTVDDEQHYNIATLYICKNKNNEKRQLDGSRREAVDGYASACAHGQLLRMLPGEWRLSGGFCLGRGGVASSIGIKIYSKRLPEGKNKLLGKRGWSSGGCPAYAYKF